MVQPLPALFVAEVGVPAALHGAVAMREPLDEPDRYGVRRGYWGLWRVPDGHGAELPVGIRLTVELAAEGLEEAEDKAVAVGTRLGQLASFFAGSPARPVQLLRLAKTGLDGYLLQQWNYYYDEKDRAASVRFEPKELRAFARSVAVTPNEISARLALGMRWYSASVGALSILDAYVATWFGLEAIGPLLGPHFHPEGPRARCAVCRNEAGVDRDRGLAAIDHLIFLVAPELARRRSPRELYELRHRIAHGSGPEAELEGAIEELLSDIQECLHAGVLTARYGPLADEDSFGWRAALPRDYEYRPDGRAAVSSEVPLVAHAPYSGGWIELQRELRVERAELDPDTGVYESEVQVVVRRGAYVSEDQELQSNYTRFPRPGVAFELTEDPQAEVREQAWRSRPLSATWVRIMSQSRRG